MNSKLLLICFLCASGQALNECINQPICGLCIQSPDCVWLSQDPSQNVSRKTGCYPLTLLQGFGEYLYNPRSSVNIIQNRPLNRNVKVSPQVIKLQLRLNAPVNLKISTNEELKATLNDSNSLNVTINFNYDENNIMTTIEALSCPRNPSQTHQTIHLTTSQSRQSVTLEIELLCKCPCENSDQIKAQASECNGSGTYQCGLCGCNELTYGESCECPIKQNLEVCKYRGKECSGRGVCVCNKCYCNERDKEDEIIFGQYCQCDNFSCPRRQGKICGGINQGQCSCGVCQCTPGWSGDDCGRRT